MAAQITSSVQKENFDPARALLRCLFIRLHKKTVAIKEVFYNLRIDKRAKTMYNTIHICTRRRNIPHNANYVVLSLIDPPHNANYVVNINPRGRNAVSSTRSDETC